MTTLQDIKTYLIIYSDGEKEYSTKIQALSKDEAILRFDPWEEFEIAQVTKVVTMQEDLEFVK